MKKLSIVLVIFICALVSFIIWLNAGDEKLGLSDEEAEAVKPSKKPVIVLIIDSLMDQPLKKAIQEGRAPALKFFLEKRSL